MKKILLIIGIITMIFIAGCTSTQKPVGCTMEAKLCPDGSSVGRTGPNCEFEACKTPTTIANPASVFCKEQNGTLEIITETDGQKGICTLNDGTKCEEWSFFRGECKADTHTCTDTEKAAQICTMDYNPVRGNDGITYGNGCGACAAKVDSYVKGECAIKQTKCTLPRTQACTREYNPTCGYFDESIKCIKFPCAETYDNPCTACADSKVAYTESGECPK